MVFYLGTNEPVSATFNKVMTHYVSIRAVRSFYIFNLTPHSFTHGTNKQEAYSSSWKDSIKLL